MDKKDVLLDQIKPILPQTLSAVRLLERCIADTEKKSLQSDTAVDTARVLVNLHQQIVSIVEETCEGVGPDGDKIIEFVNGEFKRTILLLGEALKIALQNTEVGGLSKHTLDFRNHPRTLVNMIRAATFVSQPENGVISTEKKTTTKTLEKVGQKSAPPKRIARSLSDGKLDKLEDADSIIEDFRMEIANKKQQQTNTPTSATITSENGSKHKTSSQKSTSASKSGSHRKDRKHKDKKREESTTEDSRRGEVSRRADDTRRSETSESRREESRREESRRGDDSRRSDARTKERNAKRRTDSISKDSTLETTTELSKSRSRSKTRKSGNPSRHSRPKSAQMEKVDLSNENTGNSPKKKSTMANSSGKPSTKRVSKAKKPEFDPKRAERRRSMPTPSKTDDLDSSRRRRTKGIDLSNYIGFDTDPGKRYGKVNQDAYLYTHTGKHGHIAAVFDGHGVNGEIAAQVARETFEQYFKTHDLFGTKNKDKQREMIREVFALAHQTIIDKYDELTNIKWEGHKFQLMQVKDLMMYQNKKYGVLLQDFGTTAVMAAIKAQPVGEGALEVIVANAGDSIAFIGREDEDGDVSIPIEQLCTVHNGNNEIEEDRILSMGSVKKEGHYVSPPEESGFGWAQLAVTRSLGHKYFSKYGIIPDPDISDYDLDESDRFLIVTSDGVTDVFSTQEILQSLDEFYRACSGNLQKTTTKLVKHSVGMWKKRFLDAKGKGEAADNTTAIVVDLKKICCPQ